MLKDLRIFMHTTPGPLLRGDNYKNVKMGWGHKKFFFSRIAGLGKLKFIWKPSDIVQNQVWKNHGPRGSGGATIGK